MLDQSPPEINAPQFYQNHNRSNRILTDAPSRVSEGKLSFALTGSIMYGPYPARNPAAGKPWRTPFPTASFSVQEFNNIGWIRFQFRFGIPHEPN